MLVNVPRLVTAYFVGTPDPTCRCSGLRSARRVIVGPPWTTPSMRRISWRSARQSVISRSGITGPLFVGIDTHALSEPARTSALEVFGANEVDAMIDERGGYTPTPVISHAILTYNKNRKSGGQASPDHAIRGFATPAGNTQIRNGQPSRFRVSTCSLVSCSKYSWVKGVADRKVDVTRSGFVIRSLPQIASLAVSTPITFDSHAWVRSDAVRPWQLPVDLPQGRTRHNRVPDRWTTIGDAIAAFSPAEKGTGQSRR